MKKTIIIIAGPNGAGKTTFAREYLPNEASCPIFINADLIAATLSPSEPEKSAIRAGRIMLQQIAGYAERGESFAFETTLSGRSYIRLVRRWREAGFLVVLFFLSLDSTELAIARVAERVVQGGHNIPTEVIRRRFAAGASNFDTMYKNEVSFWRRYNNSGDVPVILDEGTTL